MCGCCQNSACGMSRRTVTRTRPPRPPPARICRSAGTSSDSCRPTRSVLWRVMPISCSRSTGPSWSRRSPAAAVRAGARARLPDPGRPRRGVGRARRAAAASRRTGSGSWPTRSPRAPGLRLDGLMTVAPLAGPYAGRQQAAFERLMEFSSRLRAGHPAANMVSAGMSADLEEAVAAGATHVRVGTAVLGVRPRLG